MVEDDAPGHDEHEAEEGRPRTGLRRRLGRLLNQRELAEDTREVLGGMLDLSDRAKTEAVKLVAREARNYLDELKIKEDILELITRHSLEMKLSVHLKPLADAVRESDAAGPKKTAASPSPPAPRDHDAGTDSRTPARHPQKVAKASKPESAPAVRDEEPAAAVEPAEVPDPADPTEPDED